MIDELKRYVELTSRIRELSSPQIENIHSAEEYKDTLLQSFLHIGDLARINNKVLNDYFYPLLDEERILSNDDIEAIREFSSLLMNATTMENIDLPMIYIQCEKLLDDATKKGDKKLILLALDYIIMASYSMVGITNRLYPYFDIYKKYRDIGLSSAKKVIAYLEPEQFKELPDEYCKETVLVNIRYMSGLFDWADPTRTAEDARADLVLMEKALSLAKDPFYLEQVPDYDWKYHTFRTLEYISNFTEYCDASRFPLDILQTIYQYTKELIRFTQEEYPEIQEEFTVDIQKLHLLRNSFFAQEISYDEYRKGLLELYGSQDKNQYTSSELYSVFSVPYEYIKTIDRNNLTEEDTQFLTSFYNGLPRYVYHMQKQQYLTFLLSFLAEILQKYIEIPGVPSFVNICLHLMAIMHPPTFTHTLSVTDFTECLTKHAIEKNPELFIGIFDITSEEEVRQKADEIIAFASHAALLHDIGKLLILETIITYGRNLFDSEFDLIKTHPVITAAYLEQFPSTAPYAQTVLGHHKWFDNSAGYPEDFDINQSKTKIITSILTVADCLDASTDKVGRNYKPSKSLDEFIAELDEGSGTRYDPAIVKLFKESDVREDVEELLRNVRSENYESVYELLKSI